jgi:hypothetical protein
VDSTDARTLLSVTEMLTTYRTTCFTAGTCDLWLALSAHRSKFNDVRINFDDKKTVDVEAPISTTTSAEESTLLYDTDFSNLPAFDKQWLAVHMLALISLFSVAVTSTTLLWQTPCGDSARKHLMSLSENSFTPWCQVVTMGGALGQVWLPRIDARRDRKLQSRFMLIVAQFYFFTVGSTMGLSAWFTASTTYGLAVVNVQTAITG